MEPCPTCSDAKLNSICLALKRIQIMMSEVIHELDRDVYGSDNDWQLVYGKQEA